MSSKSHDQARALMGFVHPRCRVEWDKYGYDEHAPYPCSDCNDHLSAANTLSKLPEIVQRLQRVESDGHIQDVADCLELLGIDES